MASVGRTAERMCAGQHYPTSSFPGRLTMQVSATASMQRSAAEERANLQNTTPFAEMRSVLQYCRSGHRAISSCVATSDCQKPAIPNRTIAVALD